MLDIYIIISSRRLGMKRRLPLGLALTTRPTQCKRCSSLGDALVARPRISQRTIFSSRNSDLAFFRYLGGSLPGQETPLLITVDDVMHACCQGRATGHRYNSIVQMPVFMNGKGRVWVPHLRQVNEDGNRFSLWSPI